MTPTVLPAARPTRARPLLAGLLFLAALRAGAAPASSQDVATEPTADARAAAFTAPKPADPSVDALAPTARDRAGAPGDPLLEGVAPRAPVAASTLRRHSAAAMLFDEDAAVEPSDVLQSVARATLASVPWLNPAARATEGARRAGDGALGDLPVDLAARFDQQTGRAGQDAGRYDGIGLPVSPVDIAQELLDAARDFIAHPMTWLIGVPVLLFGVATAALSGRQK